ncbi:5'-methylthioadenosine/S-adenosylhomocysteine nucleosidase [Streptomyces paromomycinus]|uniref:5'-methylthioadenosine/S-adenosylhomocysteine nucleosidase family protein n=1 Tax=Streptomyces paromomycinus TaxID=92743 RepID=UPI0034016F45
MSESDIETARPVVVLTALGLEYEAVRAHLKDAQRVIHENTWFEQGQVSGAACPVVVAEVGPGNRPAAFVTEQARARFAPRAIFFVGVAGSLKADVRIGDVLVGTKIYAYDGAKHVDGASFARPESWHAPYGLLQTARHALKGDAWQQRVVSAGDRHGQALPKVHFKPIAAGEAVLSSLDSELRAMLLRNYNDATGIEMESAGLAAVGALGGVETLTIRGISDCADNGKEAADAAGSQPTAAAHAAAAAIEIIASLPDAAPQERSAGVPGAASAVQVNTANDRGVVNAVQHGNLTITQRPEPGAQ